jgi:hypothetical protein
VVEINKNKSAPPLTNSVGKINAVIDTGTMITLSTTCLMNVFRNFVKENKIQLLISKEVARESVWKPIENKHFSLNAARIKKIITDGTVTVIPKSQEIERDTRHILELTNNIFHCLPKGNPLKIIQAGEAEALAIAKENKCKILFVDERTTRSLVENPMRLKQVLERRQGKPMTINQKNLDEFREMFQDLKIFRSVDIIALSYEQGLFDGELDHTTLKLEAALFAAKYSGCAVSESEIVDYIKNSNFVKMRP